MARISPPHLSSLNHYLCKVWSSGCAAVVGTKIPSSHMRTNCGSHQVACLLLPCRMRALIHQQSARQTSQTQSATTCNSRRRRPRILFRSYRCRCRRRCRSHSRVIVSGAAAAGPLKAGPDQLEERSLSTRINANEERLRGTAVLAKPSIFASIYVSSNLSRSCAARQCPAIQYWIACSKNMGSDPVIAFADVIFRGRRC